MSYDGCRPCGECDNRQTTFFWELSKAISFHNIALVRARRELCPYCNAHYWLHRRPPAS